MKRMLLTAIVMSGALFAPLQAYANKHIDVVLNYNGKVYQGDQTFKLKRAVANQRQNLNLKHYRIKSVRVIAKSMKNNASVKLVIGDRSTDGVRVFGRAYNFDNPRPYTYDGIKIRNPWKRAQGRWQIHSNGTLKVSKIIVSLKKRKQQQYEDQYNDNHQDGDGWSNSGDRGSWVSISPWKGKKHDFVNATLVVNKKLKQIQVKATKNSSVIVRANIELENGRVIRLSELEGQVYQGSAKTVSFDQWHNVKSISLVTRPAKWGKRTWMDISGFERKKPRNRLY